MKHLIYSLVRVGQKNVTPLPMNGENTKFIFQWEFLDNAIGLGARILLEAITGFLLKYH